MSRGEHVVRRDLDAATRAGCVLCAARDDLPTTNQGQGADLGNDVAGVALLDRAGLNQPVVDSEARSRDRHIAHVVGERLTQNCSAIPENDGILGRDGDAAGYVTGCTVLDNTGVGDGQGAGIHRDVSGGSFVG